MRSKRVRKRMSSAWHKASVGLAQCPLSDTKLLRSDTSPPRSGLGPFVTDKALLSVSNEAPSVSNQLHGGWMGGGVVGGMRLWGVTHTEG